MHPNVLYAIYGIWGLLILASIIVFMLVKRHPNADYSELVSRTKSWWVMIVIFSIAMLTSRNISIAFLGFISFLAFKEYLSIIPARRADRRTLFWGYLMIPIQYYFVADAWYGMFIIFIPVFGYLFLPFRLILSKETKGFLQSVGIIHWGLMLTVFSISHAAYLITLPPIDGNAGGIGLLLFLVLLTQFNDVAQYCWGKMLGKRKVLPSISPNKTWEGLIGGVLTTVALGLLIHSIITPFGLLEALGASLIIGISGFIGDVTVSAVKRDIGVKDTSGLIPGHGGIMDRIDSLSFTAPLFFHYSYYLYY